MPEELDRARVHFTLGSNFPATRYAESQQPRHEVGLRRLSRRRSASCNRRRDFSRQQRLVRKAKCVPQAPLNFQGRKYVFEKIDAVQRSVD